MQYSKRFNGEGTHRTDENPVDEQPVQFLAVDGYQIRGTYFGPRRDDPTAHAVVLNSGAGIAAKHYGHFARYLAASGIPVLTYDYRGIDLSKPGQLRNFSATIEDWSEYDCAAAIEWMGARCAGSTLIGVGHSVGSLLFGGAPTSGRLAKLIMIAAHTGYYGDYRRSYRLPMALLWHGVMPVLTSVVGYFPAKRLHLGEDLPKGVAMQWARRRKPIFQLPASVPPDDRMRLLIARFAQAKIETLIMTFTDDGFATEAAAARVRDFFPNLRVEHWLTSPAQAGLKRLGHFGFFRREAGATLWPLLLDYLRAPPRSAPAP